MRAKHVHKGSQDGLIKDVQKQGKKRASPQLFSLSSLQSAMNKRYHASASQTLAAIQSLYEAKLLSYPRTDCAYITDEEFDYLVANLTKYLGLVSKPVALTNTTPNKRYVDGKKVEEHYAIIMTKVVPTKDQLATLPKIQHQVYDLVLKNTLAMFADPYEYEETTIVTQVGDANFKATGKVPTKQGWQALFDENKADQQEAATLPIVHQGDQVPANLQTPQKEMTPPGSSNLIATAMIKKSGDKIINANALTQKSNARLHE
ncbi:type IA DNA topoisomerase [Lactiplantibacillus plantarum]|nr:type IA DNA topoisomerase [Lactiplantibacillus plantarum]